MCEECLEILQSIEKLEDVILSTWGSDPAYYTSSDNNTEAEWARRDVELLEYISEIRRKLRRESSEEYGY